MGCRLDAQILATGTPTLLGSIVPVLLPFMLRGSLLQAMASLGVILLLNWFLTFKSSAQQRGKAPRESPRGASQGLTTQAHAPRAQVVSHGAEEPDELVSDERM